jgi:hypothetical protein
VPDVTNFYSAAQSEPIWASRLGASCPPSVSFPGTSVPAAGPSAAALLPNAGALALPRVRGKVAVLVPQAQKVAVTALGGQTNIHNYMTSIFTVGEGASGPPRVRGPV